MDNTQQMRKRAGVPQGGILTRGLMTQVGFLKRRHTLQISLLVSHLPLNTPLNTQYFHLIGIVGRGPSRKSHMRSFDDESKSSRGSKASILGMRKYFQV